MTRRELLKLLAVAPAFLFLKPAEKKFDPHSMYFDGDKGYVMWGFNEPLPSMRIEFNATNSISEISQWNGKEWVKV